jgi:hypothetical protein
VGPYSNLVKAVSNPSFSTANIPTANPLPKPVDGVVPVVHTPYDYYKKIFFSWLR